MKVGELVDILPEGKPVRITVDGQSFIMTRMEAYPVDLDKGLQCESAEQEES